MQAMFRKTKRPVGVGPAGRCKVLTVLVLVEVQNLLNDDRSQSELARTSLRLHHVFRLGFGNNSPNQLHAIEGGP